MLSFAVSLVVAALSASPFPAGYNGRAKTPPMGWRTWNAFHQYIDQAQNEVVMDALAAKNRTVKGEPSPVSLLELGYQSFGIGAPHVPAQNFTPRALCLSLSLADFCTHDARR